MEIETIFIDSPAIFCSSKEVVHGGDEMETEFTGAEDDKKKPIDTKPKSVSSAFQEKWREELSSLNGSQSNPPEEAGADPEAVAERWLENILSAARTAAKKTIPA